jgi:hypothetical protein
MHLDVIGASVVVPSNSIEMLMTACLKPRVQSVPSDRLDAGLP